MDFKKLLAENLTAYIKEKHTQEECIGFTDGFTKAYNIFNSKEPKIYNNLKRQEAIAWWNKREDHIKKMLCEAYIKPFPRNISTLTGREIEELYKQIVGFGIKS
jgi:hypothetical protein